mmetsp:Transcript_18253/g.33068  ORF Transcript_18253/g.33068 Transcript_18253/m.33068 type:complete len:203 (-) Transcript_18253:330-938(-)
MHRNGRLPKPLRLQQRRVSAIGKIENGGLCELSRLGGSLRDDDRGSLFLATALVVARGFGVVQFGSVDVELGTGLFLDGIHGRPLWTDDDADAGGVDGDAQRGTIGSGRVGQTRSRLLLWKLFLLALFGNRLPAILFDDAGLEWGSYGWCRNGWSGSRCRGGCRVCVFVVVAFICSFYSGSILFALFRFLLLCDSNRSGVSP